LHDQRIRKALVTISLGEEYDMNDSSCYRIRRLEAELNRNYAPEGYDCSDAITYQWVEERDANMKAHFNFYFSMEHNKISNSRNDHDIEPRMLLDIHQQLFTPAHAAILNIS
jgi:hypothetical protein